MKEHPILFSTEMVQAILAGRKTQTRRIVKPQPIIDNDSGFVFDGKHKKQYDLHNWRERFIDDFSRKMPGDYLFVRETLYQHGELGLSYVADNEQIAEETIPEDYVPYRNYAHCKVPNIHMQKSVARIWLEVTEIKVELLQDITEEDAIAEGIEKSMSGNGRIVWKHYTKDKWGPSPVHSYETLWRKINGEESWPSNPWVWVIQFKVISTIGKP